VEDIVPTNEIAGSIVNSLTIGLVFALLLVVKVVAA